MQTLTDTGWRETDAPSRRPPTPAERAARGEQERVVLRSRLRRDLQQAEIDEAKLAALAECRDALDARLGELAEKEKGVDGSTARAANELTKIRDEVAAVQNERGKVLSELHRFIESRPKNVARVRAELADSASPLLVARRRLFRHLAERLEHTHESAAHVARDNPLPHLVAERDAIAELLAEFREREQAAIAAAMIEP